MGVADSQREANCELAAYCGRFCNRARQEAAVSIAEREVIEIDPTVAATVAVLLGRLRKPI